MVGDVIADGPAARAGIEPGDQVLSIDGDAVRYWEELERAVQHAPGNELHLRLERTGKVFERYVVPVEETVRTRDGRTKPRGPDRHHPGPVRPADRRPRRDLARRTRPGCAPAT